jgi:hypothetical protein
MINMVTHGKNLWEKKVHVEEKCGRKTITERFSQRNFTEIKSHQLFFHTIFSLCVNK